MEVGNVSSRTFRHPSVPPRPVLCCPSIRWALVSCSKTSMTCHCLQARFQSCHRDPQPNPGDHSAILGPGLTGSQGCIPVPHPCPCSDPTLPPGQLLGTRTYGGRMEASPHRPLPPKVLLSDHDLGLLLLPGSPVPQSLCHLSRGRRLAGTSSGPCLMHHGTCWPQLSAWPRCVIERPCMEHELGSRVRNADSGHSLARKGLPV